MALKRLFAQQERQSEPTPPLAVVEDSTPVPSSVATAPRSVSEQKRNEPVPITPEREPGEDDAGIDGIWPPKAWSLADWVKGAKGDFHVRATLTGYQPISRGFSWKD